METSSTPPLVAVVGPTASGKTALAIDLARQCGGEIICADSRTVYTGMDTGTAKPTKEERSLVPHWGLDLVEPGQRFTAAQFKRYALDKIADIRAREKTPFLVGGTGLYVDAVIFDYEFGIDRDLSRRQELEEFTVAQLQEYCIKNNIKLPTDTQNRRRLIRAVEQRGYAYQRSSVLTPTTAVVGIATEKAMLRTRIQLRSEQILKNGVVEESMMLGEKYGWQSEAMTGNVYSLVYEYVNGRLNEDQLQDRLTSRDWRLAKRQMTWLRRNPYIYWGSSDELRGYVATRLNTKCDTIE